MNHLKSQLTQRIITFSALAFLFSLLIFSSCNKKEDFLSSGYDLTFSQDTIAFDTVFTTIGTSTQYLVVKNTNNDPIKINQIYLAGGGSSNFRINVDGLSGTTFQDIEILANDSLYIFVEVTVDPNNSSSPLLITDSIVFDKNGAVQDVDLVACGQDAFFILPDRFGFYNIVARDGFDTLWDNTKPIVIYGKAVVDSNSTLTIKEGTQIYLHANSSLWVYRGGQLIVDGTVSEPVVFQDDRPEAYYDDKPGQWDRIWIMESSEDHSINHAIIRNSFIGIQCDFWADPTNWGNKLTIKNTLIENVSGAGILSRGYDIDMENCVITNVQQYSLTAQGGTINMRHSTLGNYWSYGIRQNPSVYISNYYIDPYKVFYSFDLDFTSTNSIIYGNQDEEVLIDTDVTGGSIAYLFDHVLLKTLLPVTDATHWQSVITNQDPLFEDASDNDLHLKDLSPALEKGKAGVLSEDIEGNPRDASTPDLGAYEFQ